MNIEHMRTKMMLDKAEFKVKVETAIRMLKVNEPIEEIIEFTELSMSKIKELQKDLGLV